MAATFKSLIEEAMKYPNCGGSEDIEVALNELSRLFGIRSTFIRAGEDDYGSDIYVVAYLDEFGSLQQHAIYI